MIDKKLTSNLHTIILNEYENTEGIVILEAGQIVFEEYFGNSNSKSKIHDAKLVCPVYGAPGDLINDVFPIGHSVPLMSAVSV